MSLDTMNATVYVMDKLIQPPDFDRDGRERPNSRRHFLPSGLQEGHVLPEVFKYGEFRDFPLFRVQHLIENDGFIVRTAEGHVLRSRATEVHGNQIALRTNEVVAVLADLKDEALCRIYLAEVEPELPPGATRELITDRIMTKRLALLARQPQDPMNIPATALQPRAEPNYVLAQASAPIAQQAAQPARKQPFDPFEVANRMAPTQLASDILALTQRGRGHNLDDISEIGGEVPAPREAVRFQSQPLTFDQVLAKATQTEIDGASEQIQARAAELRSSDAQSALAALQPEVIANVASIPPAAAAQAPAVMALGPEPVGAVAAPKAAVAQKPLSGGRTAPQPKGPPRRARPKGR